MRTLLERLKPEVRDRLNLSYKDYPTTCGELESSMNVSVSFIQLTMNECLNLLNMTSKNPLSFENVESLFESN